MRRIPAAIVLVVTMVSLGGCGGLIKHVMVDAPNQGKTIEARDGDPGPYFRALGVREQFYVTVGPPPPPPELSPEISPESHPEAPPEAELRCLVREPDEGAELRGTLLVIHGWRDKAASMALVTGRLAEAGFRLVYVDLRGHGRSSGDYISYGAVESRDLSQVIDELEKRGLSDGRLGVWGVSMGAATAIQLAAHDERVDAVVAICPYRSMREIVPVFVRRGLPVAGWVMSDGEITSLVDEASAEAGFDADDADTLAAIESMTTPVLIAHGAVDFVVPYEHGESLAAAGAGHTEFIRLGLSGHLTAGADLTGEVTRASVAWFDRWLTGEGR